MSLRSVPCSVCACSSATSISSCSSSSSSSFAVPVPASAVCVSAECFRFRDEGRAIGPPGVASHMRSEQVAKEEEREEWQTTGWATKDAREGKAHGEKSMGRNEQRAERRMKICDGMHGG